MKTKNQKIPRAAFSNMMSVYAYFDKVDEGCGYERMASKKSIIQQDYELTDEQIALVDEWAHKNYYK